MYYDLIYSNSRLVRTWYWYQFEATTASVLCIGHEPHAPIPYGIIPLSRGPAASVARNTQRFRWLGGHRLTNTVPCHRWLNFTGGLRERGDSVWDLCLHFILSAWTPSTPSTHLNTP